jgi:hypothetical protein
MASEAILKELFEVAKGSNYFKGMNDSAIWKACLAYKDRPDEHIRIAMRNIRGKDDEIIAESVKKKESIEKGGKALKDLKKNEESDRGKDALTADKMLEEFFSL